MNQQIKKRWIEALKNKEKYAKGTSVLRTTTKVKTESGELNKYCAFGILCDLYIEDHPEAHWSEEKIAPNSYAFYASSDDNVGHPTLPPKEVMDWAQLISPIRWSIILCNDRYDTFEPVIEFIEKEV